MNHFIKNHLDQRNVPLWDSLSSQYEIQVIEGDFYSAFPKGKNAIITVPQNGDSVESFTHELLHVYMHSKEAYIGGCLNLSSKADENLRQIFSEELLMHIGNVLEHPKMFPIYIDMGFEESKFLEDYNQPKCKDFDIEVIETFLRYSTTRHNGADLFIGKYIAMRACTNRDLDHTGFLESLNSIDPDLYRILEEFWLAWDAYDIETKSVIYNYRGFCWKFCEDLKLWALKY